MCSYGVTSNKEGNLKDYKYTLEGFFRYVYEPEKSLEAQEFLERFQSEESKQDSEEKI